ncbi:conserved Plasmodium protein, unknown function [Plasmodium sp. DRC-Itaito]|nr:conserved Plasmodium protein, unknown function [Plasmodium sp. DRC-Itaito]
MTKEYVVKANDVYILIKICNLLDINAVSHVKTAIKSIILDLFGISMLLMVSFKIIKLVDDNMFFILKTDIRFLNLFLYAMQPDHTTKYEFSLEVIKVSNFLPNIIFTSNSNIQIENM